MNSTSDHAARIASRKPDGQRPQVMHHRWEALLFLHWRISPARIQATLPAGLTVDTFNGEAYLGVVPFFMRNVRLVGLPAVRWFSDFQELNVRTYVYDRQGTPGVWFYSLDCNQPLAVLGARLLTGLPYFNGEMSYTRGDFINYNSRRNGTAQTATYRYRGTGESKEPGETSLESFLLHRYYLFAKRGASLVRAQVSHEPYRYRDALVEEYSAIPAHLDGFHELTGLATHQCYVDGFDVKVYATIKLMN